MIQNDILFRALQLLSVAAFHDPKNQKERSDIITEGLAFLKEGKHKKELTLDWEIASGIAVSIMREDLTDIQNQLGTDNNVLHETDAEIYKKTKECLSYILNNWYGVREKL